MGYDLDFLFILYFSIITLAARLLICSNAFHTSEFIHTFDA